MESLLRVVWGPVVVVVRRVEYNHIVVAVECTLHPILRDRMMRIVDLDHQIGDGELQLVHPAPVRGRGWHQAMTRTENAVASRFPISSPRFKPAKRPKTPAMAMMR